MNIAATAFILFGLLLPGIAFRRFYYTGEFSRQYFSDNLGQLAFRVFVPSLIAQALLAVGLLVSQANEPLRLLRALVGKAFAPGISVGEFTVETVLVLCAAEVALILVAGAAGVVLQYLILRTGLDRRTRLLRFKNHWHYTLRGGIREFPEVRSLFQGNLEQVVSTSIEVLVSSSEGDLIYDGILADYELSADNQLDRLILAAGVSRRPISAGADPLRTRAEHFAVSGDFFVIPAREIKNINISYVTQVDVHEHLLSVQDVDGEIGQVDYFNLPA